MGRQVSVGGDILNAKLRDYVTDIKSDISRLQNQLSPDTEVGRKLSVLNRQINTYFDRIEALDSKKSIQSRLLNQFIDLREQIDSALDQEIQIAVSDDLAKTNATAQKIVDQTITTLFVISGANCKTPQTA